jgi:DNA phosphorothioation-dependent restriction protein DptG
MQNINYLTKALKELNAGWLTIENYDYNKIKWEENTTIPTLEQVNNKIEELKLAEPMNKLREERDNKLLETDKYSISDWPHPSEEVKQAWITYRQELRDLPSNSTPQLDANGNLTNVSWPTPPS